MMQSVHTQPVSSWQMQEPQPPGAGHSTEELHPGSGVQVTLPLLDPEPLLPPLLLPEAPELPPAPLELLLPPSPGSPGP
jgi:hypothetical protein